MVETQVLGEATVVEAVRVVVVVVAPVEVRVERGQLVRVTQARTNQVGDQAVVVAGKMGQVQVRLAVRGIHIMAHCMQRAEVEARRERHLVYSQLAKRQIQGMGAREAGARQAAREVRGR